MCVCVCVCVSMRLYTYRYTVITRMTPALRWAAMRAILNVSLIVRDKITTSVHRPQLLKRKESRSGCEPRPLRLPPKRLAARPNRLSTGHRSPYLTPSLPQPAKCPGWKTPHGRACKQYITRSYNISTFNAMRLDEKSFHMPGRKR